MGHNGKTTARRVALDQFHAGLGEQEFDDASLPAIQAAFAQEALESFDIFSNDVAVLERHGANLDE